MLRLKGKPIRLNLQALRKNCPKFVGETELGNIEERAIHLQYSLKYKLLLFTNYSFHFFKPGLILSLSYIIIHEF